MLEPKQRDKLTDAEVLAKQEAAKQWCQHATDYSKKTGGKPWKYVLLPHDLIAENMSLKALAR